MLFVLSFENENDREVHTKYFTTAKIKDYHVIIVGRSLFGPPIKKDLEHMITLEILQLVKEMITQLDAY